jgi:arsenite methyltransferase
MMDATPAVTTRPRSTVELRPARAADLGPIQRLLTEASLHTADVNPAMLDGFVVAERGERLLGVAGVEVRANEGLLRSVAVAPDERGRGLGLALVRDRIAWARRRELRVLALLTNTAGEFFPRLGFRTIPRDAFPAALRATAEFAEVCCQSATTQVLVLNDGAVDPETIRAVVRAKYGAAARDVAHAPAQCGCGGKSNAVTRDLYSVGEVGELPGAAVLASLGCGNPTALAELRLGETVLDLGSGGGIDVLLSARRVGPSGKAYGIDMTDDMLTLARENQRKAGVSNVEFVKGEIEAVPLPDASVDVVISNCVINLSADKGRVLREAFRVLRPGGRFAVSDIVVRGPVPSELRRSVELWAGCIAGALAQDEYQRLLAEAGFEDVSIEPTRVYGVDDIRPFASQLALGEVDLTRLDGAFFSGFVRARKPRDEAARG